MSHERELVAQSVGIWRDPEWTVPFIKGRVALYAILRAAGIGVGDEVVLPGFTCVVVAAAVKYTGARPVYHDVDSHTMNGDPELALSRFGPRTRAVILQHNFGTVADAGSLLEVCRQRGILVIEDCAHSIGASWRDRPAGMLGDAAFCSLQWSKPTTTGLGGIARCNDEVLIAGLRKLVSREFSEPPAVKSAYLGILSALYRNWFRPRLFWVIQDGYRWAGQRGFIQGSSASCELETCELPYRYKETFGEARKGSLNRAFRGLADRIIHRRRIAAIYRRELRLCGAAIQQTRPDSSGVDLRFPVLVENRDALLKRARREQIELGDWFNSPLHPAGCNASAFDYEPGTCTTAEFLAGRIVNLPTHAHVSTAEAERIVAFVRENGRLLTPEELPLRTSRAPR